jgi:hypothetical protein
MESTGDEMKHSLTQLISLLVVQIMKKLCMIGFVDQQIAQTHK